MSPRNVYVLLPDDKIFICTNLIPLDMVIIKGSLFANIMSIPMVPPLYCSMIYGDTIFFLDVTVVSILQTVFPFRYPRLGTNISYSVIVSALVGQS